MTKRLLIDASHAEETRVVVLDGNRLEDFDVETQSRRQLKGNIYLAKVVRVEPSLQAAFVEYGGNRHGFLAFGEIHPDYYQIPVADRQRLIAMQEEEARAEEEADEDDESVISVGGEQPGPAVDRAMAASQDGTAEPGHEQVAQPLLAVDDRLQAAALPFDAGIADQQGPSAEPGLGVDTAPEAAEPTEAAIDGADAPSLEDPATGGADEDGQTATGTRVRQIPQAGAADPEIVGGESEPGEEARAPRQPPRFMRNYKIQEVIRRRQILLIQVVKEERGTKGAALTTYISLAGRYCVLMPNSPRGGGISRKITSGADRRRLKEITTELDIPRGMGLIVRTAGAARPKPEIKRDGEYLLRLWDEIREQTMRSMAPALIHEEASLIKRAIRDVYSRDVDELLVDGEDGWRAARDYMRMLMPTHVKKVQLWPANAQPLFAHSQVESMLDAMLNPTVQLRSGGYLVINQTEALVAIDVNSGRSTRERGIEETALRTNLEAAEEAARQLRLRDLAGLIVIDFIDMESKKHNAMVERRMADALKNDRARIQIGHISHFGLLELSRQRLRPSLAETSLNICPHCGGAGQVRSTESAALHVLREIEEEGGKRRAAEILVHIAGATAVYILNNKRQRLTEIEQRYAMRVCFSPDEALLPAQTRIDRLRAAVPQDGPPSTVEPRPMPVEDESEAEITGDDDDVVLEQRAETDDNVPSGDFTADADHVPGETAAEGEQRRRRKRRRRRGGRRDEQAQAEFAPSAPEGTDQPELEAVSAVAEQTWSDVAQEPSSAVPGHDEAAEAAVEAQSTAEKPELAEAVSPGEAEPARARRGRRGGRRRRKPGEEAESSNAVQDPVDADAGIPAPAYNPPAYKPPAYIPYVGPTPADPFAMGGGMDIFDALEQAESRIEKVVIVDSSQRSADPGQPQPTMSLFDVSDLRAEADAPAPSAPMADASSEQVEPLPTDDDQASKPEPASAPVVQPVMVGAATGDQPAKKGWWRR